MSATPSANEKILISNQSLDIIPIKSFLTLPNILSGWNCLVYALDPSVMTFNMIEILV